MTFQIGDQRGGTSIDLAATVVEDAESVNAPAMQASLYAMALVLLVGAFFLSLGSWIAKQPLKKYGTRS